MTTNKPYCHRFTEDVRDALAEIVQGRREEALKNRNYANITYSSILTELIMKEYDRMQPADHNAEDNQNE